MATAADVLARASRELGKPYVFGAEGPGSFDCSGLVQYVFGQLGVRLPRLAHLQQAATTPVSSPQPGDLVFYGDPASHVGIYIGGGRMIDAPDVGQNVKVESVWGSPTYRRVPGVIPSGAAGLGQAIAAPVASITDKAAGILGLPTLADARGLVVTGLFAAAGLGLLMLGAWRGTTGGTRP